MLIKNIGRKNSNLKKIISWFDSYAFTNPSQKDTGFIASKNQKGFNWIRIQPYLGASLSYNIDDENRHNHFFLTSPTLREDRQIDHLRLPNSARQGLYWWEIDISYYVILLLDKLGLIWDVNTGPNSKQIRLAKKSPLSKLKTDNKSNFSI